MGRGSLYHLSLDPLSDALYMQRIMGYVVRKLTSKKRVWKLQFVTYAGDKQQIRDIPETEFARLGFKLGMPIKDAQARRDQLNAQGHLNRVEEKRGEISKRLAHEERTLDAYLDRNDVREFEETVLFASQGMGQAKQNKTDSHWRKGRRILIQLKIEPQDWAYHSKRFYDSFGRSKLSPSYSQKVIAILNLWGKFHCRKYGKYFEPLKFPRGYDKERIADAYYDKNEQGRVSDPILPAQLEKHRNSMTPEWFNWFYLSIWFGLRPIEVDALIKPSGPRTWHAGVKDGTPFLSIYQSKLTAVPRDKRTKIIPCIVPEQVRGLKLIDAGEFKRPSHTRHIKGWFSEHTTLYGGRKGFESLMLSLGQSIEDISNWMGHQSIERTWRSYKNKQTINFKPVTRPKVLSKKHDYTTLIDPEEDRRAKKHSTRTQIS